MKPCPFCAGAGKIRGFGCPGFRHVEIDCVECFGSGEVPASREEAITEGERRRQDRIAREVSLRDEAKRLGISPAELSDIEAGRRPA